MGRFSRRGFLAATTAGAAVATTGGAASAAPAGKKGTSCVPQPGVTTVAGGDPRYQELVHRGFNARFAATPDRVHVVHSAEQTADVVTETVKAGRQLAVRSGGHCFENFVDHRDVRALIDTSPMRAVYYDERHRAFAVQPAATLGEVYRTLFHDWGVTLPAGVCPQVGAGGHVAGGGYGPLTRRDGTVVDHLYGVEVVVVKAGGNARVVTATREPDDPNRELWWAHTGGGGGNFGIVTRYLFRTPGAEGGDPSALLPKPPTRLRSTYVTWPWADLNLARFTRLVTNFSRWYEENGSDPRYASLYSTLHLNTHAIGAVSLEARFDGGRPDAAELIERYVAAVNEGTGLEPAVEHQDDLWLQATLGARFDTGGYDRHKSKSAYLRRTWTPERIAVVHKHLTDAAFDGWGAVDLYSYGGKVNTVAADATALPQRDSILKAWFSVTWMDPELDELHLRWIRELYRDVFADTGGVPVPNADHDGCYINYPDTDLADPRWNTSGVPWHTLYYKAGYRRLQQVKAEWDPRGVFRHPLSVRLP
ncbi:FAD-linked oxidase [Streptomyces viridiviolaceus]|uniref:FAD-binding oxidoreductase n=1 Tax=Streptomyces viridiviolaceus TaxID=68282 RepID=A0ABW2DYW4_9ACTN|nr:BBE domain-containing protein [Streptomyces viridiviolaceus]GHB16791.1 FAD-linked oxidase [Streptomyces viridiviolaceus]